MADLNVATGALDGAAETARHQGATAIYVAFDGGIAGIIAIADPIKPSAQAAIAALRSDGLRIVMLTGDNLTTARAVAKTLGIEEIEAGILPERKSEAVQRLRSKAAASRWSATASTTRRRWPRPTSASPWAAAPMWRSRAPG